MKCPKCQRRLRIEATNCLCGWSVSGVQQDHGSLAQAARAERARQLEHQRTLADESHAREVREFMQREGLHSVKDCRVYCQRMVAKMKHGELGVHTFERWCAVLRQATVDRIVLMDPADGVLDRLRNAGVIDDANRLVSIEQRAGAAEERRAACARAEENPRARALDESLEPAQADQLTSDQRPPRSVRRHRWRARSE